MSVIFIVNISNRNFCSTDEILLIQQGEVMKLVATAVTLALLSFGAYAAGVDANNDGKISAQELKACDFDNNSIITKDEAKNVV
jgi:hypothetical protein